MQPLSINRNISNTSHSFDTNNTSNSTKRQSGYNIDLFIDQESANKYLCSICHHVVSDCHETINCGHIFCGSCIARALLKEENKFRCPYCQINNHTTPRPSKYLNRAVGNLIVKCPFHTSGCTWAGTLSDLIVKVKNDINKNHLSDKNDNNDKIKDHNSNNNNNKSQIGHLAHCKYAPLTCEKCNQRIKRKDIEIHNKKCKQNQCSNCKMVFNSSIDRNIHFSKCPSSVNCRLCGLLIKRDQLRDHCEKECLERQVRCPYYNFGCSETIKWQNLKTHLKYNSLTHNILKTDYNNNKIEKYKIKFENVYKIIEEQQNKIKCLTKSIEDLKKEHLNLKSSQTLQAQHLNSPAPDILILSGNNKWEESGIFMKRYVLHQGRVSYTSIKTKCAIRWNPDLNAWLIDRRGLAYDNEASLIAYQDVSHPGLVTTNWLVYNDDLEKWVQSENYRIQSFNLAEFLLRVDHVLSNCDNNFVINPINSISSGANNNSNNGSGSNNSTHNNNNNNNNNNNTSTKHTNKELTKENLNNTNNTNSNGSIKPIQQPPGLSNDSFSNSKSNVS